MKKFFLLMVAFFCCAVTFAQTSPATSTAYKPVFPVTASGNRSTFGAGTITQYNNDVLPFVTQANGDIGTTGAYKFPTGAGSTVPMSVSGNIGKLAVAAAIGRFAGKLAFPLSVGVALYDLAKELNYNAANHPGGGTDFSRHVLSYHCDVNYTVPAEHDGMKFTYYCLPVSHGSTMFQYGFSVRWDLHGLPGTTWPCGDLSCPVGDQYTPIGYSTGSLSEHDDPVTNQEFVDAIAAKSGWPSSSALARTLRDALNAGESVAATPTAVTGPASAPGPSSSSSDPANHTTSTDVKTEDFTYSGPTVTTTETDTVSTTDTGTGTTTTKITTTTPTTPDPSTDSKDPCVEHPGRVGCMDSGTAPPAEALSKTSIPVAITPVTFASSSSCPPPIAFEAFGQSYQFAYDPLCERLASLKYLFLVIAGLMAAYILSSSFKV